MNYEPPPCGLKGYSSALLVPGHGCGQCVWNLVSWILFKYSAFLNDLL